jgi:hypothetical protein
MDLEIFFIEIEITLVYAFFKWCLVLNIIFGNFCFGAKGIVVNKNGETKS